jgi:hypothetical protein
MSGGLPPGVDTRRGAGLAAPLPESGDGGGPIQMTGTPREASSRAGTPAAR